MRYDTRIYTKGICPDSGTEAAIGVAACVIMCTNDPDRTWVCMLRKSSPPLTENIAAVKAILVALDQAWEIWSKLQPNELTNLKPRMNVQIFTDSEFAFDFMTDIKNGRYDEDIFIAYDNIVGYSHDMHDRLHEQGGVRYELIPSAANKFASEAANDKLDEIRQERLSQGNGPKV